MPENSDDEIELRVGEIPPNAQEDIGSGIVRIDSSTLQKLGIREGDPLSIRGSRETAARAERSYPADVGLGIVRMDGYVRKNAGTSLGEHVQVKKADVKEAKKVVLAPAEEGVMIQVSNPEIFKKTLLNRVVTPGDLVVPSSRKKKQRGNFFEDMFDMDTDFFSFSFGETKLMVTATTPSGIVTITEDTKLEIKPKAEEKVDEMPRVPEVTYEDIGGLDDEIQKVREMIELPLKHPEVFNQLGIEAPSGVMLYGPPGTGKTLLAKAVANEADAYFTSINGPELMSKFYGESEKNLRKKFEEAQKNSPAIIFIDELDAIAPKRDEAKGEVERRVVAQLLSLMDGLEARKKVIVIAATNRHNDVDEALRRPGRFDREIEIGVPNRDGRKEILQIHTRNMPLEDDVDLDEIADKTYGYVGADIEALCKEGAMITLRRVLPNIDLEKEKVPSEVLEELIVSRSDMVKGMHMVEPSAMREVLLEIPKISWDDVGGLEEAKERLKEMVEWPLKNPQSFKNLGIKAPRGILLYGMPGTGKTMLAKAVANESEANFISVKGPQIFSKWVGESEKAVRKIFSKARQASPCIIFIDEIDAVAPRRERVGDSEAGSRVVNQLLAEMDGIEELEGVVVIAASNRPDIIDPAVLRPGRLDRKLEVPIPDEEARKKIFEVHMEDMPLADDIDLDWLARETENYVGSGIESVCREAAMHALRNDIDTKQVTKEDFEAALEEVGPSAKDSDIKDFEERTKRMSKSGGSEEAGYYA